jgi:hypothetical protein
MAARKVQRAKAAKAAHKKRTRRKPTGEQYAAFLNTFLHVNPQFQLSPGIWRVNQSLTYQMLQVTFKEARDAARELSRVGDDMRKGVLGTRFGSLRRSISGLIPGAVREMTAEVGAFRSERDAIRFIATQVREGLIRPVVTHLVFVWLKWATEGSDSREFERLVKKYERFRHPTGSHMVYPRKPRQFLHYSKRMKDELEDELMLVFQNMTGLERKEIEVLARPAPLEVKKLTGKKRGRPPIDDKLIQHIKTLRAEGMQLGEIATETKRSLDSIKWVFSTRRK